MEAYLAHKWQLEEKPELHPYYKVSPTFGGNQDITWLGVNESSTDDVLELPVKGSSDPDFTLYAVASSGLPVIYSSSDPTILAIAENQAKILRPGKVTITAYQTGNTRFFAALPQSVSLEIIDFSDPDFQKDNQIISFSEISEKVREDPPFQIFASAQSTGNHPIYRLPVVLKIESGPATIDPLGVITLDGSAGTIVISASQSGNAFVEAAPTAYLSIEVSNRTRPTILFTDFKKEGDLPPILIGSRPINIPGVSNGSKIFLDSIRNYRNCRKKQNHFYQAGKVTLQFNVPENDKFVAALTRTRTIEVIKPTRPAWVANRRNDEIQPCKK